MAGWNSDPIPRPRGGPYPPGEILALGLITVLAAALRLFRLDQPSLWRDEIETMFFSVPPLAETVRRAAELPYIPRPPLYFILNHLFLAARESVYALRLFPALCSILAVAATWFLVRRWFGGRTALVSAFLLAVSPYQIHYAQEAREYAFIMLFSLVSLILLDRVFTDGPRWFVPWAAVSLLLLYTHHFSLIIVLTQGFAVLVLLTLDTRPRLAARGRLTLLALAAGGAVVLLWLPLAGHVFSGVTGARGMKGVTLVSNFSWADISSMLGLIAFGNKPGAWIFMILAALGLLPWGGVRKRGQILAVLWMLPVTVLTFFGDFAHTFHVRYYIFVIPVYLAVMARGAGIAGVLASRLLPRGLGGGRRILRRGSVLVLAAAALGWSLPYLSSYYREERSNWRAAASFLSQVVAPGDIIAVKGQGRKKRADYYKFVLEVYGVSRGTIDVMRSNDALGRDFTRFMKRGVTIWFVGTRPRGRSRLPFMKEPDFIRTGGYSLLAPIAFEASTTLSERERRFLAPYRYNPIYVLPFAPGHLHRREVARRSRDLLARAESIPRSFVEKGVSHRFLGGARNW
jgi:uncharacterized membrane protein